MILHINDTFAAGGTERFIAEQLRYLKEQAVDVHALSFSGPLTVMTEADLPGSWTCLDVSPRLNPWRCARALRRFLRASNPSVVQVHSFFGLLMERMAQPYGRNHKIVATLHNQGYLSWPARTAFQKFRKGLHGWLLRGCDVLTAVSQPVVDHYDQQFELPSALIIPNPLPVDVAARQENLAAKIRHSRSSKRLVIPGRITREKGHKYALLALAQLQGQGFDWKLDILGDGPLRPEIETMIASLALENLVRVRANLCREAYLDQFQSADLCLIPSVSEGFGIVALEAMALNVPVIASAQGGLSEIIRHEENGWLFPAGDVDALASLLTDVLQSNDIGSCVSSAARETAREFSIEIVCERWRELYRELEHAGRQ